MNIRKLTRRDFLKLIGIAAGAGIGAYLLGRYWSMIHKPPLEPPPPKSTVAVIKGDDLYEMTRNAINSVGGINSFVNVGDKVFIKPNFAALGGWSEEHNTITNGQCTKPEIILATAEECLKAGASRVVIGEAGQGILPNGEVNRWEYAATLDGRTNLVTEVARLNDTYGNRVSLEWLSSSKDVWKFVPSRTEFGQIAVSSVVTDADKIISIPVLKTHHSCAVTLSLKNFMGVTPVSLYGSPRLKLHQCDLGVEQCFLDVVKGIKPNLAIIDASIGAEGNAPAVPPGKTVYVKDRIGSWLLIASNDLVAADSTATRIIGHEPQYVKHLRMAFAQEMGEMREDHINVVGAPIAEVRMDWIPSDESGYPQ
jgi:uncharacterized protein (DUF362 family)